MHFLNFYLNVFKFILLNLYLNFHLIIQFFNYYEFVNFLMIFQKFHSNLICCFNFFFIHKISINIIFYMQVI